MLQGTDNFPVKKKKGTDNLVTNKYILAAFLQKFHFNQTRGRK